MGDRFGIGSAAGYDLGFGSISSQFIPALLRAARIGRGHGVLDVATGTGVAAELAAEAIGPCGHVIATDLSPAMLEKARERPGGLSNVSIALESGQSLAFRDGEFDAVVCAMGLMLLPDPASGLMEFRRVLREHSWAAVSVNTTPERAFVTRVDSIIARHVPERAVTAARYFSLGNEELLRSLFAAADFHDVETVTETRHFAFTSFEEYFDPIEEGRGPTGQAFVTLSPRIRQAVRDDVRRQLEGDAATGGPIDVEVRVLFGCGRRWSITAGSCSSRTIKPRQGRQQDGPVDRRRRPCRDSRGGAQAMRPLSR